MTVLLSGKPKPRPPLKVGDRVRLYKPRHDIGPDGFGWILHILDGGVQIAHVQADDGRPDPLPEWTRETVRFAEVQVHPC
ncbi:MULTISPECIES: hypothetical protein [Cryobacterium]|uniref:DUF1918 domain-containing protein n=1 Tax=Cryobacterium breve TaxID=1259258 RepID=A0ABY2J4C5_9MICO|nr:MULTISPECIES: hypothetical protein [Cryobacterium]TFC92075.1 hypothetical protein E3T20_12230 [Cryobacterium sp. TmT3-12]TFC99786.1 hypothetical protein E3O65_05275 [Cryobacterium breve]